ncbi:Mediator of RNA polymerase II transcription subunit 28 [Ancistrocladus abbreviatus]
MADRQQIIDQQQSLDPSFHSPAQSQIPTAGDEMIACVTAMETALLPCLPARELQAIDRSAYPSHQSCWFSMQLWTKKEIISVDVERHARDFMEAAKKLQMYFISLQRDDHPSKVEMLQKKKS